jgi:hypothetical protein
MIRQAWAVALAEAAEVPVDLVLERARQVGITGAGDLTGKGASLNYSRLLWQLLLDDEPRANQYRCAGVYNCIHDGWDLRGVDQPVQESSADEALDALLHLISTDPAAMKGCTVQGLILLQVAGKKFLGLVSAVPPLPPFIHIFLAGGACPEISEDASAAIEREVPGIAVYVAAELLKAAATPNPIPLH